MLEKIIWLAIACLVAVFGLLRYDLIHFSQFYPVFAIALIVAFVCGVVLTGTLVYRLYKSKPTSVRHVVASLAGMLPIALLVFNLQPQAKLFPPIHDISTDTANPPQFQFAGQDRVEADHPVDYDIANIDHQQNGYPSLQSLRVNESKEQVTAAVIQVVESLGWKQLGVSEEPYWQLEAMDQTPLFRYKDDVAIRVESQLSGQGQVVTTIAVRSASRVGGSDLGANAKRIGVFYDNLKNHLSGAAIP